MPQTKKSHQGTNFKQTYFVAMSLYTRQFRNEHASIAIFERRGLASTWTEVDEAFVQELETRLVFEG